MSHQPAKKEDKNLPALRDVAGPPAELSEMLAQYEGAGISTAQEDNLVPLIYIFQSNSPQVNDRSEAYLEGARQGDIWLRASSDPIASGTDGILFQPCHWSKVWVEWVPRTQGGGFIARHRKMPKEAQLKDIISDSGDILQMYVMPNGNELKETREHAGYVLGRGSPQPYVIPFTSTGHSVSREWMTRMGLKEFNGRRVPTWACVYRLTTKHRKNKRGEWFVFNVTDAGVADGYGGGWVHTSADLERGAKLFEAFESGARESGTPEVATQSSMGADDIPF
jgi:hypothetical protein